MAERRLISATEDGLLVAGRRIAVTRGQLMLLMVAINEIFLGIDIYLAHAMNGTIRPYEWIPIIFGPAAGIILLIAGVIALKRRRDAILLAFLVLGISIVVGLLGAYFHVQRAIPPSGVDDPFLVVVLFIFAPPVIGPLTFSLVGVLGVIAAVYEDPPNSGHMVVPGLFSWQVPFSKTRQYYIWVGLGILATTLSSVLDHGRFNFENVLVWIPTVVGVFATVSTVTMGLIEKPSKGDYITYVASMIALIVVGVLGFVFHTQTDLTSGGVIVPERFMRGAPFLAPLLFADMAALGLVALIPLEDRPEKSENAA